MARRRRRTTTTSTRGRGRRSTTTTAPSAPSRDGNRPRNSRRMESRTIWDLPDEILLSIFSYLPIEDIKHRIPGVNDQWEALSKDPRLWRRLTYVTTSEATMTFGAKSWESTLDFLASTPELQKIVVSHGHLDNEIEEIFTILEHDCQRLRELEVEMTPVVTSHLKFRPRLTSRIESLKMWIGTERQLIKGAYDTIPKFKNLREITFMNSNPAGKEFRVVLDYCPMLKRVNASNDVFCKWNFLLLMRWKRQFLSLDLRVDDFDRECIEELSKFPNLNKIGIVEANASREKLLEISRLQHLDSLVLREDPNSPVLTSSALRDFFQGGFFPRLRELKLHKTRLDDSGAAEIRRNCPALTYLEILTYPKCKSSLTEMALLHFLHCRCLASFDITFDSATETDWIYRRRRYLYHDCDVDGVCPVGLEELLHSWDEVDIPVV